MDQLDLKDLDAGCDVKTNMSSAEFTRSIFAIANATDIQVKFQVLWGIDLVACARRGAGRRNGCAVFIHDPVL